MVDTKTCSSSASSEDILSFSSEFSCLYREVMSCCSKSLSRARFIFKASPFFCIASLLCGTSLSGLQLWHSAFTTSPDPLLLSNSSALSSSFRCKLAISPSLLASCASNHSTFFGSSTPSSAISMDSCRSSC